MYPDHETEISHSYLSELFSDTNTSICLLGGWAVFQTVNKNFNEANGRDYMHSKDIDIGFHIDKKWSDNQFKESDFAIMRKDLLCKGFKSAGYRLIKYFDNETQKELTEQQAKNWKYYQMSGIYIDSIVDVIHPKTEALFGFRPIDEPLLNQVFEKKRYTICTSLNGNPILPSPEVLLATKINSVVKRGDESHKRIKDITDIYALLWYSDTDLSELKKKLFSIMESKKVLKVISKFSKSNYSEVSKGLGVDSQSIITVIDNLKIKAQ